MIGFCSILFLGCISSVLGDAPPYVQSSEAFVYAKAYVSGKLPNRKMDLHKVEDRPHLSFAMLTGVTNGLVLLQNTTNHKKAPLEVVDEYVPLVWKAYSSVSEKALSVLNDATHKVSVVVNLINSVCGSANVEVCNAEVDKRVKDSPLSYQRPAELLISLGKVSNVIRDNEKNLNSIVESDNDVPYLIKNVSTKQFLDFVDLLKSVNHQINELAYRRMLTDSPL